MLSDGRSADAWTDSLLATMFGDDVGVLAVWAAVLTAHDPSRLAAATTATASVARRGKALAWVAGPVAGFGPSSPIPLGALWS